MRLLIMAVLGLILGGCAGRGYYMDPNAFQAYSQNMQRSQEQINRQENQYLPHYEAPRNVNMNCQTIYYGNGMSNVQCN